MPRGLSAACALICALLLLAPGMAHAETPSLKRVQIKAPDGVTIDGAVVMPARPTPGRKYPAIAFAAAWNGGWEQNTVPALKLASKGYVVHLYTMRGMAKFLDGEVNMAGPNDRMDMTAVIDWLIANRPVDPDRIGAAGISYGAGLALIASAFDPRIRSVASFSGWTDLNRALWPNETRNAWAGGILYKSAVDASRVGPEFLDIFHRFFRQVRVEENLAFGAGRSAQTYIDQINENQPAILMSQQWNEMIFPPDQILDFYEGLEGPKRLLLQPGDHVSQESPGLLGLQNRQLNETYAWFDRTLKNAPDPAARAGSITLQPRTPWGDRTLETYPEWSAVSTGTKRWYLGGGTGYRTLAETPQTGWGVEYRPALSTDDGPGGPLVGHLGEALTGKPLNARLASLDRRTRAMWMTPPFAERLKVRGAPRVRFTVTPQSAKGTVIATLFSVSPRNVVFNMTHTPLTWRDKTVGEPLTYELALRPTAYDIPPGHKLLLSIAGQDLNYILDKNPPGAKIALSSPESAPSFIELPTR